MMNINHSDGRQCYYSCQHLRKKIPTCPVLARTAAALYCLGVALYTLALNVPRICRFQRFDPILHFSHAHHIPSQTGNTTQEREKKPLARSSTPTSKRLAPPPSPTLDTVSLLPRVSSRSDTLFSYMDTSRERWRTEEQEEGMGTDGRRGCILNQSIHPTCFFVCSCVFFLSQPLWRANPVPKHHPFIHQWNLPSAAPVWACAALRCAPCSVLIRSLSLPSLPALSSLFACSSITSLSSRYNGST